MKNYWFNKKKLAIERNQTLPEYVTHSLTILKILFRNTVTSVIKILQPDVLDKDLVFIIMSETKRT